MRNSNAAIQKWLGDYGSRRTAVVRIPAKRYSVPTYSAYRKIKVDSAVHSN